MQTLLGGEQSVRWLIELQARRRSTRREMHVDLMRTLTVWCVAMSSRAPKQAESEFDDLLGQLVDELAMTPPSQSAVALVPDLKPSPPAVRVDSTNEMAAAAAAAAGVMPPAPAPASNSTVKIVGIIAASLTAVAVAALMTFGGGSDAGEAAPAVAVDDAADQQALAQAAVAHRAAVEQAHVEAIAAERAEVQAAYARAEAERLVAQQQAEQAAAKPKPKPKPRNRPKPKPKPTPKAPGSDFDKL
ncbi:hypothetical protein [Enhygromyxa salina]|nr:hypothetical protein [Enhygromyxa salina]